jgi:hypothetical protein
LRLRDAPRGSRSTCDQAAVDAHGRPAAALDLVGLEERSSWRVIWRCKGDGGISQLPMSVEQAGVFSGLGRKEVDRDRHRFMRDLKLDIGTANTRQIVAECARVFTETVRNCKGVFELVLAGFGKLTATPTATPLAKCSTGFPFT